MRRQGAKMGENTFNLKYKKIQTRNQTTQVYPRLPPWQENVSGTNLRLQREDVISNWPQPLVALPLASTWPSAAVCPTQTLSSSPGLIPTALLPYHLRPGWAAEAKTGAHEEPTKAGSRICPSTSTQSAGSNATCCKRAAPQPKASLKHQAGQSSFKS